MSRDLLKLLEVKNRRPKIEPPFRKKKPPYILGQNINQTTLGWIKSEGEVLKEENYLMEGKRGLRLWNPDCSHQ
jgi:hypothetical protein